jgi:hypothetical protein
MVCLRQRAGKYERNRESMSMEPRHCRAGLSQHVQLHDRAVSVSARRMASKVVLPSPRGADTLRAAFEAADLGASAALTRHPGRSTRVRRSYSPLQGRRKPVRHAPQATAYPNALSTAELPMKPLRLMVAGAVLVSGCVDTP